MAAGETFVQMGYAVATVADILKTAGMSRRSFYEFFTSKEDILSALLEMTVSEFKAEFSEATKGTVDSFEAAILTLLAYIRMSARLPLASYQTMAAGGSPREHRIQQVKDLTEALHAHLTKAYEQRLITYPPNDVVLHMLVGGIDHLVISYPRDQLSEAESKVREMVERMFKR